MYKVVLVEDEPLILEGLRLTGPWPAFDCQVVGEAADALEAEAVIRRLRPDIVITDIHMPGISGLQLIERLRGSVPCEWIILSGYDQFEYARKAVNLGVKGYLLKPVDDEELKEVLRSTLDSLRRRQGEAAPATGVIAQDSGVGERYLARAKVLMEKRCAEDLTLHGVAAELDISESYLGKLFKNSGGPTFLELLTLYRMKKAVQLLQETDKKVYEIAELTGYRDAKYFSAVFRKVVGCKPLELKGGFCLAADHPLNHLE